MEDEGSVSRTGVVIDGPANSQGVLFREVNSSSDFAATTGSWGDERSMEVMEKPPR